MPKIKFERITSPAGSVEFSQNPNFGSSKPILFKQPKDFTDGGFLYIYNKGLVENNFELIFNNLPEDNYQNMENFFKNIAQGSKYSFTYYDENGDMHTVRLMDEELNWKITLLNTFNDGYKITRTGTLVLRKE